ncbi:hypothetical protein I4U23_028230 [Adineta vaga]|nr:hypothetical protein I4U23_028230 [Adineta vaga]
MKSRFEHLPNELIFLIFSNISWSNILICFWSLNKRIDQLISSFLSSRKNGLVFIEPSLSLEKRQTKLFPLISQSSLLLSSIRRIHFDGTNSNSFDLINEWLFDNEKKSSRFSNLQSLILTRCLLNKSLFDTLPLLIKYQLDELTLLLDKNMIEFSYNVNDLSKIEYEKEKLIKIFEEIIEIIFSNECRLTSLKFNFQSLEIFPRSSSYIKTLIETNGIWFKKVSKLKSFTLKSSIWDNLEFAYFKWLLNNLNHIETLSIHLESPDDSETDEIIWNSIIDANFLNIKTSDEIIYSFQIHPAFLNHQWTNIKCLFDPILSNHKNYVLFYSHVPKAVNHSNIRCIRINIDSNLHSSLRQLNQLFPNVSCIKVNLEYYMSFNISTMNSLITAFEIDKSRSLRNIQLHNVTRLDFSPYFSRRSGKFFFY